MLKSSLTQIAVYPFLFVALLLVSSCQKTGDIVNPPTKAELLADGAWKLSAQIVDPGIEVNGVTITNEYNQLENCKKDDLYNFNVSKSFTKEEGATKCDPADPQIIITGTWELDTEEVLLTLTGAGFSTEFEISNLTRDRLVVIQAWTSNNIYYTRTHTFEHE